MKKIEDKPIISFFNSSNLVRWIILSVVMIIFTIILYPNLLVTEHSYEIGEVADKDIKAARDFFITNEEATKDARKEAEDKILTLYDQDVSLLPKLSQQVRQSFEDIRKLFEVETERKRKESEADSEQEEHTASEALSAPLTLPSFTPQIPSLHDRVLQMKGDFEKKIGITVGDKDFDLLIKEEFRKEIEDIIVQILKEILENGVVANKDVLLREGDKGIVLRDLGTKTEGTVQNLRKFYGPDEYKDMVKDFAASLLEGFNKALIPLVSDFCIRLIQPNITLNRSETEERKAKAAAAVEPVRFRIRAGEMILREGDIVTDIKLLKLENMNSEGDRKKLYARSVGAMTILLILISVTYTLHINRRCQISFKSNKDLLFIAALLAVFFFVPKISASLFDSLTQNRPFSISASSLTFGIPLGASAMTICVFAGFDLAVFFAMLISVCTALIFQNRFEIFIYFLISCIMAAYWIQDCRERKVFITAGIKLGCFNVLIATATDVYAGNYIWSRILWDWVFAFMGGLGSGILTVGIAPLIEIAFGYTSDITLHELANLDRPLLRRLMLEAPGTYHHSVVVGSMVEAAAAEIGANPLLAKVCGYYHDIGKLKQPVYFIENQNDGKNRHDKLAPSMSALILISHVKHGVEMGKKDKLGQAIIDTIQQHHGTSFIRFFYEKAKQLKGEESVKSEDFRYPGPKPQTREAGLVMLADVVEAASRTLDNPTPSRIQGHVQKLINGIFSDGQLDNCELTLRDLNNIAKSFNKILNGIHHHRIEYPEKTVGTEGKDKKDRKETLGIEGKDKKDKKEKDDRPDQQPPKQERDKPGKSTEDSSGSLKRLGMS
jgi:putative nucleotidyltransferase with HDIG domain